MRRRGGSPLPESGVGELGRLASRLKRFMAGGGAHGGGSGPAGAESFETLALEVFRAQCRHNPAYGAFVRGRGLDPGTVDDWRIIPAVPAGAFRDLPLVTGDPGRVRLVFRTSGTTREGGPRGEHRVMDPSLYEASLLPNFRAHLLPDGERLPLISLIPPPEEVPDSSLSWMMGAVSRHLAAPGGGWFVDGSGALDGDGLARTLQDAEVSGQPVLLAGTAFAWVHGMDAMDRRGLRVRLPEGSRLMETGGFKGRSRELPAGELYRALEERLGIPPERMVNEYGMTELLSQFYQPVLQEGGPADPEERRHRPPLWVRTRILDPTTLRELPPGEPGLLVHLDLANLYSVACVLTQDLGVAVGDGFRVLGRVPGSEARGCSLAMDELLSRAGSLSE